MSALVDTRLFTAYAAVGNARLSVSGGHPLFTRGL